MEPVRIKYYGVLPLSKRRYLVTTAVTMLVAGCVLVAGLLTGLLPPLTWPWEAAPVPAGSGFLGRFVSNFWRIVLLLVVLELIEIVTVLRRFVRKEAEQRARLTPAEPKDLSR